MELSSEILPPDLSWVSSEKAKARFRISSPLLLQSISENALFPKADLCNNVPLTRFSETHLAETNSFRFLSPPINERAKPATSHALINDAPGKGMPIHRADEIHHFLTASNERFLSIRSSKHITQIIRCHAALREQLCHTSADSLSIRLFRSSLFFPEGRRNVLSVCLAMRSLSDDEHFNERHLASCLKRCVRAADLVPQSFYSTHYANEHTCSYYFEIEKEDLSPFSSEEIDLLTRDFKVDIQASIEKGASSCILPHNEEESLRTTLLLSQQIKRVKDVPQVMIHYRGHSDETIDFSVVVVRVIQRGKEQPFTLTKLPEIIRLIPIRNAIVGTLRQKHQKHAVSFIAQCSKSSFLRYNHSLDVVRARETVVQSLQSSLGAIRDVNGGLFFQQNNLIDEIRPLLSIEEQKELYIVENLFHSLTPCITKHMVSKEHMLTLFRHFRELRQCTGRQKKRCKAQRNSTAAFVSFLCPKGCLPEEILLLKSYLQVPDHCLATCHTPFSQSLFGFAICFSEDQLTQTRFIESAQRIVDEKKRLSSPPRIVRLSTTEKKLFFDPRQCTDISSGTIIKMLYEGLTEASSDTTIANAIAESISISEDALTYTFSLRPSSWSNMAPLSAHDFVYAWKKALLPECKNPFSHLFFPIQNARQIKAGRLPPDTLGAHALSERTLSVTLASPCPEFLLLCSHWIYSPLPTSIDEKQAGWNHFCDHKAPFNGPFKIAKQLSSHTLVLEKNPLFWDTHQVEPESITVHLHRSSSQAHAEFEQGELDWIGEPVSSLPVRIKSATCSVPSPAVRAVALNVLHPLFASRTIRMAFSLALHRSSFCRGDDRPAASLLPKIHSSLLCAPPLPFNMMQAQELFHNGVRDNGISLLSLSPLRFLIPDLPEDRRVASAAASAWEEAFGIKICLLHVPQSEFFLSLGASSYDLAFTTWHSIAKDSMLAFEPFEEPSLNPSKWSFDPLANPIRRAAFASSDRRGCVREAEELLIHEMPIIPLFDCNQRFLTTPSFPKFSICPFGTLDFQRMS